jgi:hypothetical protein
VSVFDSLRRAWQRHDQKLAVGAYANQGAERRLDALDDQLETAEIGQKVYGVPSGGAGAPPISGDDRSRPSGESG